MKRDKIESAIEGFKERSGSDYGVWVEHDGDGFVLKYDDHYVEGIKINSELVRALQSLANRNVKT